MVVGVVGSREFRDKDVVFETLDSVHETIPVTKVVSGGARGADKLGVAWAKSRNVPFTEHKADWYPNGVLDRGAGHKRNPLIVRDVEVLIAFVLGTQGTHVLQDSTGKLTGTGSTVSIALKQGKKVYTVNESGIMVRRRPQ